MANEKLRELKERINKHLENELDIMEDMLKSNLTKKEWNDIVSFIHNHPTARFNQWIREKLGD